MDRTEMLKPLAELSGGTRISIYIPTERVGPETQQNPIRLKNQLQQAEAELESGGWRKVNIAELLTPAWELVDDKDFWEHQEEGLALFLDEDDLHHQKLAATPRPSLMIGETFYLTPLVEALQADGRFYLLSISQNQVQLYAGNQRELQALDVEDMPSSLKEALPFDQFQKQLQHRTGSSMPGKGREGMFHGQGTPSDDQKDLLRRFLHKLDEAVQAKLGGSHAPLVIAAVDYLHPIYKEANSYPNLYEEGVVGNQEHVSLKELHSKAWQTIAPHFERGIQEAIETYADLSGGEQAIEEMEKILPAAHGGQVRTLLVRSGAIQWGRYDRENNRVDVHSSRQMGDQDLVNLAARHTLLNGGDVFVLPAEEMLAESPAAATLRY